jgi:hypothetical protein
VFESLAAFRERSTAAILLEILLRVEVSPNQFVNRIENPLYDYGIGTKPVPVRSSDQNQSCRGCTEYKIPRFNCHGFLSSKLKAYLPADVHF